MQLDAGQENAQRAQDKNIANCCQLTNRLLVGSAHSNISHFLIEDDVFFFTFYNDIVIHIVRQNKIHIAVSHWTYRSHTGNNGKNKCI